MPEWRTVENIGAIRLSSKQEEYLLVLRLSVAFMIVFSFSLLPAAAQKAPAASGQAGLKTSRHPERNQSKKAGAETAGESAPLISPESSPSPSSTGSMHPQTGAGLTKDAGLEHKPAADSTQTTEQTKSSGESIKSSAIRNTAVSSEVDEHESESTSEPREEDLTVEPGETPDEMPTPTETAPAPSPLTHDPQVWSMASHDPRRTGRTCVNGPRKGNSGWTFRVKGAHAINMEPTATRDGVFFGTWGVVRGVGMEKTLWDKGDGKIFGLNPRNGAQLFHPLAPAPTPFAYKFEGRAPQARDLQAGLGVHLSSASGRFEGCGAVDTETGVLYYGRSDCSLYAVDPKEGRVLWQFKTFDPDKPGDPEGGGAIIGGPLTTADGMIIFATQANPPKNRPPLDPQIQTNAVYAIDRKGELCWRYPERGGLPNAFNAPVALSADGERVYAVTALMDEKRPCELIALERKSGRLIWQRVLPRIGGQDLAVGKDGVIYVAGMSLRGMFGLGIVPVAFAVRDNGINSEPVWGPVEVDGKNPLSHMAGGVALYENEKGVESVYISTTIIRSFNTVGGRLHKLDPASGQIKSTWNPFTAKPSCVGGLTDVTIDGEGVVYVGVRGRKGGFLIPETQGRMYALKPTTGAGGFETLWSRQIEHQIDCSSPAIGPSGSIYFGSTDIYSPGETFMSYRSPVGPGAPVPTADPLFYCVRDQ